MGNGNYLPVPRRLCESLSLVVHEHQNKDKTRGVPPLISIGRKIRSEDLVFFVEDDYLHFESMLEEMISSFQRIASQLNKDIFMSPSDYPYLYMNNENTNR